MSTEYLEVGDRLADQDFDHLSSEAARRTAEAIANHCDFALLELRRWSDSEALIVDCETDGVWSRNPIGIRYRERLALCFPVDTGDAPEVRALRRNFPVTLHQNHVIDGQPSSLCLYFGPWSATRRTWTPQSHLRRIQWWLTETANGTLHRADQPPEQLYFESSITLVLPPDFDDRHADKSVVMAVELRTQARNGRRVVVGSFKPNVPGSTAPQLACIVIETAVVQHGPVERTPATLGQLAAQFARRGVTFIDELLAELQRLAKGSGLLSANEDRGLFILRVPVVKHAGDLPRVQTKGFVLHASLGQVGERAQVLLKDKDRYHAATLLGGQGPAQAWQDVTVEPLEVIPAFRADLARRYSGIGDPGPIGVLAGVGALGSAMANIWIRQGWGRWTYIDPDSLLPHNLARHTGFQGQVGHSKVDVVRSFEHGIYPSAESGLGLRAAANDFGNDAVKRSIESAALVIDVSTTFEVPRDLSANDHAARSMSAFITPSGKDSVLLVEDVRRTARLDVLETQYYRFIIEAPWGETHLAGHSGDLWVGAGCRDLSAVMPIEQIQQHAATLASQVRLRAAQSEAAMQVWRSNPSTGGVETIAIPVAGPLFHSIDGLRLVWDEGLRNKIRRFREERLPLETGGVLLGYFDQTLGSVYIADALPAPADSKGGESEFSRGVEGLQARVEEANRRTGKVVGYIGEWHSHPRGVAPIASTLDIRLMVHLALVLHQDGLPALMLIVGDETEQWLSGDVRS
jgi:integrative and conjugative element protein (TIGR02256 family)